MRAAAASDGGGGGRPVVPRGPADQPQGRTTPGRPRSTEDVAAFAALEWELTLLIRRSRTVQGRLGGQLHDGLDGAVHALMLLLDDAGPLRAGDLVARLGMDKSTVSRQVTSLVDLGLVERAPDQDDGRAQLLSISAEGHRRVSGSRAARRSRWEADLSDWDAEEVAALATLLERLNQVGAVHEQEFSAR
ncbi:MarR family winged helix-turn-helix transcriptional regulator [Modestobacter sp. VKM Ac-2984]|uniref:MarR family winged helix-turn-helix transcriptional regulator n=1 Tax=Modestobacter sp. VKM Ac-2984 TaxID=3004138 RepID=UPI0022AB0DAA|nr:MarR family transcriptional regulator [Modestobacter sp. VKM Ac-2984]MCZ2816316.1 MarR family transcriptional regulator [Modestobacter sp. VKM Ac-2984]